MALAFFSSVTSVRENSDGQPPTKQGKNSSPYNCRPFPSKPNYVKKTHNSRPSPCLFKLVEQIKTLKQKQESSPPTWNKDMSEFNI